MRPGRVRGPAPGTPPPDPAFKAAMSIRALRTAAIVMTALALVPFGAHLLALPNKIGLPQDDYFAVQQIYQGWAFTGALLVGALLANVGLTIRLRHRTTAFAAAVGGAALIVIVLGVFFVWTWPTNQATANWTVAPADWSALRARWEYSHAVNAVLMILALACVSWTGSPQDR